MADSLLTDCPPQGKIYPMHTYAAVSGQVVTEAHVKACAAEGHKTHTVDGVDTGICPRCGESTVAEEIPAVFEKLETLESDVHGWKLMEAFGRFEWERTRAFETRQKRQAELYALLETLSPAEAKAYGEYRTR